jgi:hypothetical protein
MNKTIVYDFPKLPSQKINSIFSGNIQYSVAGKENQPNISVVKKSQKRGFVSKNVYIFSNIHNVSGESDPCTGELVIEHDAITNGGKKLYVCVPLITNHLEGTYSSPNVLDELIQDAKTMDEIELNSVLPGNTECYYYETKGTIVVIFKTAVAVQSHFTGFSPGNIVDIQKPFLETSSYVIVPASKRNPSPGVSHCVNTRIASNKLENHVGANYREGFSEGLTENTTTSWMECDNVDLDYSQDVPTYAVTSGSNLGDPNALIRGAVIALLTLIGLMIFIFGFPWVYFGTTKNLFGGSNLIPQGFLWAFLIIGFALFIAAIPASINGQKNMMDIIISGVVFFGFSVCAFIYLKVLLAENTYIQQYNLEPDDPSSYWFMTLFYSFSKKLKIKTP